MGRIKKGNGTMHGRALRHRSTHADGRALMVECPDHKGILLPVTDVHMSWTNNFAEETPDGKRERRLLLYLEALCVYCGSYKYVHVTEGRPTRFTEDETLQLRAAETIATKRPGIALSDVLDEVTSPGRSRAAVQAMMQMAIRVKQSTLRLDDGRVYTGSES